MNGRRAKIAFIGTHGVGKTTLCYGLAARLKRRDVALDIVHEVARRSPLPINEETTATAQRWILLTQIAEELVACARYPVVLCDRSVLDNYVYLLLAAGADRDFEPLVERWLRELRPARPRADPRLRPRPTASAPPIPASSARSTSGSRAEVAARGLAVLRLDPADAGALARPGRAARPGSGSAPAQLELLPEGSSTGTAGASAPSGGSPA